MACEDGVRGQVPQPAGIPPRRAMRFGKEQRRRPALLARGERRSFERGAARSSARSAQHARKGECLGQNLAVREPRITKQVLRETKSRLVGPQRRSPAVQFEVDPHGRGRLTLAHVDADAHEIPHAVGVGGRRPPHGYQRGAIVVAGFVRAHVDRPRIVDWASHGEWAHVENTASRARAEARDAASEAPISRRRLDRRKPRGGARGGADSPGPNSTPGRDRSSASGLDPG